MLRREESDAMKKYLKAFGKFVSFVFVPQRRPK